MFFTSTLVPNRSRPTGRMLTLTSFRIDPRDMSPSHASKNRTIRRNSEPYAATSRPVRKSGSVTISSSATPARLKSAYEYFFPSSPFACVNFPASSSKCARVIPTRFTSPPSSTGKTTSMDPS